LHRATRPSRGAEALEERKITWKTADCQNERAPMGAPTAKEAAKDKLPKGPENQSGRRKQFLQTVGEKIRNKTTNNRRVKETREDG